MHTRIIPLPDAQILCAQRFVPVRIRHRPAVEYEAAAVAGLVLRQPTLVREGYDGDDHIKRLPNDRPCLVRHGE